MPKKGKKFIDKNNSVTFHLVHRSQQDPLAADETAPQRVLVPIQEASKSPKEKPERLKEQQKYGIYFDDDYNYLQHLRDTNNTTEWVPIDTQQPEPYKDSKLQLPSSVFESSIETEVGLLNKAAPPGLRLDLDPEIIAAMDEDFDFDDPDNQLEDDFMAFANAKGKSDLSDECNSDDDCSDENQDEVASLDESQFSFKDEETRSRFTDYSMSSSVIQRNSQLTLLDYRFEQMYLSYDDNEIGALDYEDIEGNVSENSDLVMRYASEFHKPMQNEYLDNDALALRLRLQQECGTSSEDGEDADLVAMQVPQNEKWDCESILSTYSNIHNHPKLITEPKDTKIKINTKTGIPKDVLNSNKLTAKALRMLDDEQNYTEKKFNNNKSVANSVTSLLSTLSVRNKHESLDEKRKRKRLLKEHRKERREEKKLNSKAFREESINQTKIAINMKNNLQGNKIV